MIPNCPVCGKSEMVRAKRQLPSFCWERYFEDGSFDEVEDGYDIGGTLVEFECEGCGATRADLDEHPEGGRLIPLESD